MAFRRPLPYTCRCTAEDLADPRLGPPCEASRDARGRGQPPANRVLLRGRAPAPRRPARSRAISVRIVSIGAAAVLLSACSSGKQPRPVVGAPMPAYTVETLSGDSVSVASMKGEVVLLNLWATWCAPCRQETPYLESVYRSWHAHGLEVLGVSLDTGSQVEVRDFVRQMGVTYTVGIDPEMRAMDLYQVPGLPASFLVDRNGILRWMRYGPVSESDNEFLTALETLLK
jgi:peroxiredoxin